jgi:tetratricopeptide (TPR) repeat protein
VSRSDDEAEVFGARDRDQHEGPSWKVSSEFVRRGLALGEGFALYVVAAEQLDTREALVRALGEDPALALARVDVAELEDVAIDRPIEAAQRRLIADHRRHVVVVTGLEELAERMPELMPRLNEYRNELRARIEGAMVWLGTPVLLRLVQRQAPDVWSARAADLELDEAPPSWRPPPLRPKATSEWDMGLTYWDLQLELKELPRGDRRGELDFRIAELLQKNGKESNAGWYYKLAAEEVEDPAVRALALARSVIFADPDPRADSVLSAAETAVRMLDEDVIAPERAAYAWSALASAWRARGDLDRAERATSQALRLARQSGHGEPLADALAEHAEQLAIRGNLYEASARWHEMLSLPQPSDARLGALVRAGTTAALAGRRDWLGRHWREYLAQGGRPWQLDDEIDALDGHAAALAREVLSEQPGCAR